MTCMCDNWEHVGCLRYSDKLSDELYQAITGSRSRALLYVCTRCRAKGSIIKRLHEYEVESARAQEQRLASAQRFDELNERLRELREERQSLLHKQEALEKEVQSLHKQFVSLQVEKVAASASERSKSKTTQREEVVDDTAVPQKTDSSSSGDESTEDRSSNHSSSEGSLHLATQTRSRQGKDPHPPGFRTLINRIDKFSGHQGDDDFELWLLDFKEVTTSCGWDDNQRSKWFSWFLSVPAKATWQRTLKEKDKRSWKKIVEIYRGQYGIHLDPRIAYQRCQELQYSQFGSAQGLLDAMRNYQQMAPEKLTDATMESILWNKVPVELQQELKEIPDGSVQELLKKLLRAESVVAERKRRRQEMTEKPSGGRHYVPNKRGGDISKKSEEGKGPNSKDSSQRKSSTGKSTLLGEASMQHIKCYKCKAKGHMARDCPEVSQKPM